MTDVFLFVCFFSTEKIVKICWFEFIQVSCSIAWKPEAEVDSGFRRVAICLQPCWTSCEPQAQSFSASPDCGSAGILLHYPYRKPQQKLQLWGTAFFLMHPSEFPGWGVTDPAQFCTLIGEYHFRGPAGLYMLLLRERDGGRSNSCSGNFTRAFLAFSSLAPSSVEPLSPQRTWKQNRPGYTVDTRCF